MEAEACSFIQVDNLAVRNDMAEPPAYEAGGAGLASTLDDYMKFARMLRQNGTWEKQAHVQILKPETLRYMRSGQLLPVTATGF